MRVKNTIKNSLFTMVFQLIILVAGLIVPRWIISLYGSEINGFTSNINQVLNLINLLQAGMVGASIFEMYEPINKKDYYTVGRIFFSSEMYFKKVSKLFFVCTLFIIPYIVFFTDSSIKFIEVIISVLIMGINATFVFREYCKYDVIFTAHQKKYILVVASMIEAIVYYTVICVVLINEWHYIFMYVSVLIGSIVKIGIVKYRFKKEYMSMIESAKTGMHYKVKNQGKLFGNQIIQNVMGISPTIVVSMFYGLNYASVIYIYSMVVNVFKMVFTTLKNSVAASFGDLTAAKNNDKTMEVFNLIQCVYVNMSIMVYIPAMLLILPFVRLYSGNISNIEYEYKFLGIYIVGYIVLYTFFLPFNMLVDTNGLYGKVLKSNIVNGIISLIFMIAVTKFNFENIYLGLIVFYLVSIILRFVILKREKIILSSKNLIYPLLAFILIMSSSVFIDVISLHINSWGDWIFVGGVIVVIMGVLDVIIDILFYRKEIKMLKNYIVRLKK